MVNVQWSLLHLPANVALTISEYIVLPELSSPLLGTAYTCMVRGDAVSASNFGSRKVA